MTALPTDFLVEQLSRDDTAALCCVAAKKSVMLNDLLVRDYFLMLSEWNRGTAKLAGRCGSSFRRICDVART